jgi:hypothetical protein
VDKERQEMNRLLRRQGLFLRLAAGGGYEVWCSNGLIAFDAGAYVWDIVEYLKERERQLQRARYEERTGKPYPFQSDDVEAFLREKQAVIQLMETDEWQTMDQLVELTRERYAVTIGAASLSPILKRLVKQKNFVERKDGGILRWKLR